MPHTRRCVVKEDVFADVLALNVHPKGLLGAVSIYVGMAVGLEPTSLDGLVVVHLRKPPSGVDWTQ